MALLGPLLSHVLRRIEEPDLELGFLAVASVGRTIGTSAPAATAEALPVTALVPRRPPSRGEPWLSYWDDTLGRAVEVAGWCPVPVGIPGAHGTHCAGIIASRDEEFRDIAPGVRLVNIKVGREVRVI